MTPEETLCHITFAHDLKNHLSTLLLMADQLPDNLRPSTLKFRIKIEIRKLIDDLEKHLNSAFFLGQALAPNYKRTRLGIILNRVKEHQEIYAEYKSIRLQVEEPMPDLAAEVDARLVEQALRILVNNAIKFSPQGGEVAMALQLSRVDRAEIRIHDTGPGLSALDRDHLFRPLNPLSSSPTMGENSTGLGLTLAKKLMRLHGGRIWAAPSPGSGSTFVLDIPIFAQETGLQNGP